MGNANRPDTNYSRRIAAKMAAFVTAKAHIGSYPQRAWMPRRKRLRLRIAHFWGRSGR